MNNHELALLIYSVGQYEGYKTSLLQTEKNLSNPINQQFTADKDRYIYNDLVKAINFASQNSRLTVSVIKGINGAMNSKVAGQPEHPGILRNNVTIHVGEYTPPKTVTEEDLAKMITNPTSLKDSWKLYAQLAKLQPFDDGNKRTALIAANLSYGAFNKGKSFLTIPIDYRKVEFDANLINYYMADDLDDHLPNVDESLNKFSEFASSITESEIKNNQQKGRTL